jgi:hypothetical protein
MLVLLKLRFNKYFHENRVNLYLKTSLFGDGHFLNGFIVLNVDYNIVMQVFPYLHILAITRLMARAMLRAGSISL